MINIDEILTMDSIDSLSPQNGLQAIARLIDYASEHRDLTLTSRALTWCDQIEPRLTSDIQRARKDYFRANAWANRQRERQSDRVAVWAWDQEELQQQIFFLRRALNSSAYDELDTTQRCQILTNLANQLDTAGRFVEARALWTAALRINPAFWMARGNRGRGLMHYAHALQNSGHKAYFALKAHDDLTRAVQDIDLHPELGDAGLRNNFVTAEEEIQRGFDLVKIADRYRLETFELSEKADERSYQQWCLRETLFLNPLNDVESLPISAKDVLTLPDFVTSIDEPPILVGLFNQLKQEFVSARWLYFDGINTDDVHHSDRNVVLYNTLDYTALDLGVEKVKIAFRMSYSLLDKIAYFINHYMKLGIPEKNINFRNIWREKNSGPVRVEFSASENWPFRGLFWLSKDIFEKDFKDLTEPDARELHELRNHLEHKYVKVLEMKTPVRVNTQSALDVSYDNFAHSISRHDLEQKTLRILQLVRSALIYLSLGMQKEERRRQASAGSNSFVARMALTEMADESKRRW
ncbi:MAG: LA2681 family HEPN domain-containing protein [Arenimonas sp.]